MTAGSWAAIYGGTIRRRCRFQARWTFRTIYIQRLADKVAVRPDVATMLPSWPAALRAAVSPFFPKLLVDYDASPPHHLISFHGPMGWPAPAVDLQLVHRYVVPPRALLSGFLFGSNQLTFGPVF